MTQKCLARCPVWAARPMLFQHRLWQDPLATAKPEDLQHASLVLLQRLSRPERRLAPELRRAAAAVDAAGRDLQRWVRRSP